MTARRWALNGLLDKMLATAQAEADANADIDRLVSVDSTIVRAHRRAAGAQGGDRKRTNRIKPSDDPADRRPRSTPRAMGPIGCWRSCSPPATSRLHSLHPGHGRDQRQPAGPGRSRTQPVTSSPIRAAASARSAVTYADAGSRTPSRSARTNRTTRRPATSVHELIYRHGNVVEHCFNRLKQCRSVATRYDKTSSSFHATVITAARPRIPPAPHPGGELRGVIARGPRLAGVAVLYLSARLR